jgi:hypothetical protein
MQESKVRSARRLVEKTTTLRVGGSQKLTLIQGRNPKVDVSHKTSDGTLETLPKVKENR